MLNVIVKNAIARPLALHLIVIENKRPLAKKKVLGRIATITNKWELLAELFQKLRLDVINLSHFRTKRVHRLTSISLKIPV